jgi:uncharacterized protein (DUF433 family)
LRRHLILSTYPGIEQSAARLVGAGWRLLQEQSGTRWPFRVAFTDGRQLVMAEGGNREEAWYRAARQVTEEQLPMMLPMPAVPVPLSDDGRGGVRVGESLFPLDVLIREYEQGTDPEGIVHAYPALQLADVYAVIAYHLRHKEEVQDYLEQREGQAKALRREIESRQPARAALRAKLPARRAQQQEHAASGG